MEKEKVFDNLTFDDETTKTFDLGLEFIQTTFKGGDLVLLASSFGQGKTSLATKIANNLYMGGCKILQLSSEDKIENIQHKHFAAMTGIPLNEIKNNVGAVNLKAAKIMAENTSGEIFLRKGHFDDISDIETLINETINRGSRVDVLVIDTISQNLNISVLRKLAVEHNFLVIGTVQGNRESMTNPSTLVQSTPSHLFKSASFVMGIHSTLKQKKKTLATISILKNRYGADGISGEVYFNRATLEIRNVIPYWDVFFDNVKKRIKDVFNEIFNGFKRLFSLMGSFNAR